MAPKTLSAALVCVALAAANPTVVAFNPSLHAVAPARFPRATCVGRAGATVLHSSAAAVAPGGAAEQEGGSTMAASIFNLCKGIMGAGALSLPASICAIGDVKGAIAPAVGILALMGAMSAYTFTMIGEECHRHKVSNFEDLWAATVGPSSKWVVSSAITVTTFLACIAYAMIIGDLFSAMAATAGVQGMLAKRSTAILGVSGLVVAPLCFLKSLSALSFTSLAGVAGVFFSVAVMGVRFFDGSYVAGGKFLDASLLAAPSFGAIRNGWKLDHMTFVVLSCLGTAFLAHFNAPTFFNDLKQKSVPRFRTVVNSAFGISTSVFAAMMVFGFGTFGSATAGNVFVNYNKADSLALACRLAMAFSITFTYPIAFVGLKKGVFALMNQPNPSEATNAAVITALLAVVTGVALVLQDLGFVAAITGSLMGSTIIYTFPALFKLKSLQQLGRPLTAGEKASTYGLMGVGGVLTVVGVTISVLKQFTTLLG